VPDGIVYEGYRNRALQRETREGVEVVRVWTYLAPNKGTVRRILNYLSFMVGGRSRVVRAQPDVVIATSPQFFCGWAGVIATDAAPPAVRARGPRSVARVDRSGRAMRNRRLLRFLEWLERRMYAAADHVVTVGGGYRDKLMLRGVDRKGST
jgi:hypothetical protein